MTSKSTRPEISKRRANMMGKLNGQTIGGKGSYFSFPSKPMPHGLLLQFKKYDYNTYVNGIKAIVGEDDKGKASTSFKENNKLGFVNTLTDRDFDAVAGKPQLTQETAIELPFPRTLQDNQNIRVQQFERDFLYERLASGLAAFQDDGGVGGMAKNMLDGLKGIANQGYEAIKSLGDGEGGVIDKLVGAMKAGAANAGSFDSSKATALAGYLARNFISGEITKSISVVGERVVNPQETLSFSGVDLRNFTFTWDLYPSNQNDSESIKNIVRLLKQKALPQVEDLGGGGIGARAFLNYPSIVELNLLGVDESHFMRFKRCMIQSVNVDYGGGGMPEILKGGKPAVVSISITFSELQINTAEDYGAADVGDGGTDLSAVVLGAAKKR
jgi:hypothetical protein